MRSFASTRPAPRDLFVRVLASVVALMLGLAGCGGGVTVIGVEDAIASPDSADAQVAPDTGCSKGCDDSNPCTLDECEAVACKHTPIADKTCDDGNPCTTLDHCTAAVCAGSKQLDCDDKNVCTTDSCDLKLGCVYAKNDGVACDDGDGCTQNDVCSGGKCGTGGALTCDDGNPCTTDACNLKSGCQFSVNTAACSDGNACTLGDTCNAGQCIGGALKACADNNACTDDKCDNKSGVCVYLPNPVTCDDGNVLTQGDTCVAGQCVGVPGCGCVTDGQCDDKNPCTKDVCTAGCCVAAGLSGGVTCTDGNSCTQNDLCDSGSCVAGAKQVCDDGNACTDDACLPDLGCTHSPNAAKCDDGLACSTADVCKAGTCTSSLSGCGCTMDAECADGNACTDDACVAGKCASKASGTGKPCEDGNGCSIDDTCLGGVCLPGAQTSCDDGNPCSNDACNPADGGCVHASNFAKCSDGNACTHGDLCAGGVCQGGAAVSCDDGNVCTDDACDPTATTDAGGCSHLPNSAPCDDGSPCTQADVCLNGACGGSASAVCDDGNPCTDDSCNAGSAKPCAHAVHQGACDDGDPCTTGDVCDGILCVATTLSCDDQNPCTDDSCDASGACQHAANGAACSDGNACTSGDLCVAGSCAAGAANSCDDGDACTADLCDPVTGCSHTGKADGATCLDAHCSGLSYAAASTCLAGVCVPGAQVSCDDGNACSDDACAADAGCSHSANTLPCDDANLCTSGDICGGGVCLPGAASSCDDGNLCSVDACDPNSGCQHDPATDGSPCASASCSGLVLGASGVCSAGSCALTAAPIDCDDGNACTDDFCSPTGGCSHQGNTTSCSDGNPCTVGDTCALGQCSGGAPADCTDNDVCTEDACAAGTGCTHAPAANGKPCDDGSICTTADSCSSGACAGGAALLCDDANPCTTDSCTVGIGCVFTNNTVPCDDGSQCNAGNFCAGGKCAGIANPCDDGNPCTTDTCDGSGGCTHGTMADGAACSSQGCAGAVFQGAATCQAGICGAPPSAINCADGNDCTDDWCNSGMGCMHAFNASPCGDGNACTASDTCVSGVCTGAGKPCADGGACSQSLGCDVVSGCQYVPLSGNACSDGNACTVNDACASGVCASSVAMVCDDNNTCTSDACDPAKGCVWTALDGGACTDGNVCTVGETCASGACVGGAAMACDDLNPCTNDSCDPSAGCHSSNNAAPCSDGDKCTSNDTCAGGACQPGAATVCDDGNPCTSDACDSVSGCIAAKLANGTVCGAGACAGLKFTGAGVCTSGQCILPAAKTCDDGIDCTADVCDANVGCSSTTKAWGSACTTAGAGLLAPFCAGTTCTGIEVKVGDPSPATQGALTGIDRNNAGILASGWDNTGSTTGQTQGTVRAVNEASLAVSDAGKYGVAKSRMNDYRDVIAVGGIGDYIAAMMVPSATSNVPSPVVAVPGFTRALNAIDAFTGANGMTYVFGGGGNSNANLETNVGVMTMTGGVPGSISRVMITTSPTQCDKQVPMTVSDIYAGNDAAIYFAGYIGQNGQAPKQSAVAVWDGSATNGCEDINFGYAGEAYVNTSTSTMDRLVPIANALGQGAYRAIHGVGTDHLLVGGTLGTLWSYDNGAWTQQTPVVPGGNAWSTQYDVKSVYLSGTDGWATGELYGASGGSSNCRQIFLLHGVFDPTTSLWTWNQLILPGIVDCGTTITNTQANKVWRDASTKAIYVVGAWGGKELVARIKLP